VLSIEPELALRQSRDFFASGATRDLRFRKSALHRLARTLEEREPQLLEALRVDLGKPAQEAWASEIGVVSTDIAHATRRLRRWARSRRRSVSWGLHPAMARVYPEPQGVVLILGPWNYPFQLLFSPLVAALAAGNCVCLKPSELAPEVAKVIAAIIDDAFEPGHVAVVAGDVEAAKRLVELDFDHIFLTGSTEVGRQVMGAAARNLTPVTLELGGKSPCIVDSKVKLDTAARRIAWGKFLNAGQTCVAPDHLYVHASVKERFLEALRKALIEFFGDDPRQSPDFGRIVNRRHFERLRGYLDQGEIVHGGQLDENDLYIAPTLLAGPRPGASVLEEEIFGPILPVLTYEDMDEVLAALRSQPPPLAMYLFTESRAVQQRFLNHTVSGGLGINDVVNQIVPKELPFGGVGESGMGRYHGKSGFDCFSHLRSVLRRSTRFDPGFQYPPARVSLGTVKRAYRWLFRN
jgi:aldehyde dehydrogenase (NAD+)